MHVLGLTGGIACGKSTVSAMLRARGLPVLDADQVARDVVAIGSEGLAEVRAAFGPEVLDAQGALDRARLGARVFADSDARARLNAILHPLIAAESARRLGALSGTGHAVAVYDAALLVENGLHHAMAALLVVTASRAIQRARLRARDGLDDAAIEQRLDAQLPLARKVAAATYVIDNSGGLESLRARVAEVYASIALAYGPLGMLPGA